MAIGIIRCSRCNAILPPGTWNLGGEGVCICGAKVIVKAFPALLAPIRMGQTGEHALMDDQATCFYHPNKKAAVPCDHCGRFLCSLCDVDFDGSHMCPKCIERGKKEGRLGQLHSERPLYDSAALAWAIGGAICPPTWLLSGPMAAYYAIRYWNGPTSLLGRTKVRNVLAIALGALEVLAWPFVGYWIYRNW